MESGRLTKGCVTLPAESGKEDIVLELAKRCGADVIRDSDGTVLSQEILDFGFDIYSTLCIVRADQDWPGNHPTHLPQQYLMSHREVSGGGELKIEILREFYDEKYRINEDDDPKQWWEVIDRTKGEVVASDSWEYADGWVVIDDTEHFHEYTVNFLVYQTWDSVSMYNHLINDWQCEKTVSLNPFLPEVYQHLMGYFQQWLEKHPSTTVVRFTTFAFMFMLINDSESKQKICDWMGYCEAVSPAAILEFERIRGYRLRSEDFVDMGRFNPTSCPPSQRYLDWIDFIHGFVVRFAKDLVSLCHQAGKKAAMFWGDHWIGLEPYSPLFQQIGMDIHIGACNDGTGLRRISDAPGAQIKEIRLYPYFFPDTFKEGGNPTEESMQGWIKIRRALIRKPIDRIGWGGYLSLAYKFPDFIDHMEYLSNQFREILERTQKKESYKAPIKVAVLDCWGKRRAWLSHFGVDIKFMAGHDDTTVCSWTDTLECLAGLPVNVDFMSFQDIIDTPDYLDGIDVIINDGQAGSSWSGGDNWKKPQLLAEVRKFVYGGGGFIGVCEPSACEYQGRFFQLADILGVQKETGKSLNVTEATGCKIKNHFITEDLRAPLNTGLKKSYVFAAEKNTQILDYNDSHIHLAVNEKGQGRSVFLSGLPFSFDNSRLLQRAIFWVCGQENNLKRWFASHPDTDVAYYRDAGCYLAANNSAESVKTIIFDDEGRESQISLEAYELKWKGI